MSSRCASKIIHCSILVCLLFAGLPSAVAQVGQDTLWRDAIVTELDVDFGDTGFHARWRFFRCLCGDVRVEVEETAPDEIITGELMLVGGRVLLARGFENQGGGIEQLIQAPTLMMQLALDLLNRSQPQGPQLVTGNQAWHVTEKNLDLKLDTGLTTATFSAPWKIEGTGWESGPGRRRFELLFDFTIALPGEAEVSDSIKFSGEMDFRQQAFPYPESTDLNGWVLQWISARESETKPADQGLTLKGLREQAK